MKARTEMGGAVGLLVLGSAMTLFAADQVWFTLVKGSLVDFPGGAMGSTGRDVASATFSLGLVGLAGVVAAFATKGLGRRFVGALIGLAGLGITIVSLTAHPQAFDGVENVMAATPWRIISAVGGVLVLSGGLAAVLRSQRWPAMGARYQSPAGASAEEKPAAEKDPWKALDRGDDPTR